MAEKEPRKSRKQSLFLAPTRDVKVFEDDVESEDGEAGTEDAEQTSTQTAAQKATAFLNSPEGEAYLAQDGGAVLIQGTRRAIVPKVVIGPSK